MAKDIKYTGTSDFREVALADLRKAGYEGDDFAKSTFTPGDVYTIDDDAAADALLKLLPNEFEEASDKDLEELENDEKSVETEVTHEPGAGGGDGTPPTTGSSGRGSTKGATPTSGTSSTSTGRSGKGSTR